MKRPFPARQFLYLLTTLTCCLAIVTLNGVKDLTALAQSGCAQADPQRYPAHSKVYYDFGNITDPEQRRQIGEAIRLWNQANQSNNSRVEFLPGPPPAGTPSPRTLNFQNGETSGGAAARMDPIVNLSTEEIVSATVRKRGELGAHLIDNHFAQE